MAAARTWYKLKKKPAAMCALVFIIISCLLALTAFMIAPDRSPNANRQQLELQGKPPGFQALFLRISKPSVHKPGVEKYFMGIPSFDELVPIISYSDKSNGIEVLHYIDEDTSDRRFYAASPDQKLSIVKKTFYLGTDTFGRDILSRILAGLRISLAVGFIAVLVSLLLGISLGTIAGYFGGKADAVISWLILVTWSIPTILLVFAFTMAFGKGFFQIFLAVGLTLWVQVARLVRGQVIAAKELEYIQAARALGFSHLRIMTRHILPNIMGPILVLAASTFASAIMIEAGLSFLGIGIQPPRPSLGLMLREHYAFVITHRPLLAIIPGAVIMLLVLAFNILGNGLRDAIDVNN